MKRNELTKTFMMIEKTLFGLHSFRTSTSALWGRSAIFYTCSWPRNDGIHVYMAPAHGIAFQGQNWCFPLMNIDGPHQRVAREYWNTQYIVSMSTRRDKLAAAVSWAWQQTRDDDPMPVWCRPTVFDGGPTSNRHWVKVLRQCRREKFQSLSARPGRVILTNLYLNHLIGWETAVSVNHMPKIWVKRSENSSPLPLKGSLTVAQCQCVEAFKV